MAYPNVTPLTPVHLHEGVAAARPEPTRFTDATDNWYDQARTDITASASSWKKLDRPLETGMSIDDLMQKAKAESWISIAFVNKSDASEAKITVLRFDHEKGTVDVADSGESFAPTDSISTLPAVWVQAAEIYCRFLGDQEKRCERGGETPMQRFARRQHEITRLDAQLRFLNQDLDAFQGAGERTGMSNAILNTESAIRRLRSERDTLQLQDLGEVLVKPGNGVAGQNDVELHVKTAGDDQPPKAGRSCSFLSRSRPTQKPESTLLKQPLVAGHDVQTPQASVSQCADDADKRPAPPVAGAPSLASRFVETVSARYGRFKAGLDAFFERLAGRGVTDAAANAATVHATRAQIGFRQQVAATVDKFNASVADMWHTLKSRVAGYTKDGDGIGDDEPLVNNRRKNGSPRQTGPKPS